MRLPFRFSLRARAALALTLATACSGSSSPSGPTVPTFEGGASGSETGVATHIDGGQVTPIDAAVEASTSTPADTGAQATRNPSCTPLADQTGTAIDSEHGRLDGTLVYVIPPGQGKNCNGDDSHIHLQVLLAGSVYDIAVDIGTAPNDEVGLYETTMAIPDGTFAEGWHSADELSYPTLGIHSTSFTTQAPTDIASQVEALLANTTSISIFCTGYAQEDGCHDVHYENGSGKDGAILLNPTAATSPVLFFRFATQTF